MKEKNTKLLLFEAGVLIMILIIASISSAANVTNLLKKPPVQPTGIPYIPLKDDYEADKYGYLRLEFTILYGTAPYNVTIYWGDGKSKEIPNNDGNVLEVHKYEICRNEPYRLTVLANDSDGHSAYGETDVYVKCLECDLSVDLKIDYETSGYPFVCEDESIWFEVTVKSSDYPNASTCDLFDLILSVSSPGGHPYTARYGPISRGNKKEYRIESPQLLGPGSHTANVIIIPIDIIDIYPENSKETESFYVFSAVQCYFLKIFWDLFGKVFNRFFPNELYGLTS